MIINLSTHISTHCGKVICNVERAPDLAVVGPLFYFSFVVHFESPMYLNSFFKAVYSKGSWKSDFAF